MHAREGRAIGVIPTNDGLTLVGAAWRSGEFREYRRDIEGNLWKTLELAPRLADRVRAGRRQEAALLRALVGNQSDTNRFCGLFAGTVSIPEFMSPDNVARITGVKGGEVPCPS